MGIIDLVKTYQNFRKHLTTVHNGASGFEGECPDIQFDITDIIDKVTLYFLKGKVVTVRTIYISIFNN